MQNLSILCVHECSSCTEGCTAIMRGNWGIHGPLVRVFWCLGGEIAQGNEVRMVYRNHHVCLLFRLLNFHLTLILGLVIKRYLKVKLKLFANKTTKQYFFFSLSHALFFNTQNMVEITPNQHINTKSNYINSKPLELHSQHRLLLYCRWWKRRECYTWWQSMPVAGKYLVCILHILQLFYINDDSKFQDAKSHSWIYIQTPTTYVYFAFEI